MGVTLGPVRVMEFGMVFSPLAKVFTIYMHVYSIAMTVYICVSWSIWRVMPPISCLNVKTGLWLNQVGLTDWHKGNLIKILWSILKFRWDCSPIVPAFLPPMGHHWLVMAQGWQINASIIMVMVLWKCQINAGSVIKYSWCWFLWVLHFVLTCYVSTDNTYLSKVNCFVKCKHCRAYSATWPLTGSSAVSFLHFLSSYALNLYIGIS